ncbi:MAG: hypothetical protein ACRDUW_10895 [Pseudonocardiaceae bacterium]
MGIGDQLGTKLGPRLATLMAQAATQVKADSLGLDHQRAVGSAWTVITQAGNEAAGFTSLISKALLSNPELPEQIRDWVEENMSGRNQIQALLAGIGYQALGGSGISAVFGNLIGPWAKEIIRAQPNGDLPYSVLAELVARGIYSEQDAGYAAAGQGIAQGPFQDMVEGARSWPASGDLFDLVNRGLMSEGDALVILTRAGLRVDLAQLVLDLRHVPPSPAAAASLAAKGILGAADAEGYAAAGGQGGTTFAAMLAEAYGRLPLGDVLRLWQRGIIDRGRRDEMATRLGLAPEDLALLDEAAITPPSPPEALNALLEGQIDEATARARWAQGGGDPSWFTDAFNTNGQAPTPTELILMANRGIIPWTGQGPAVVSFEQGFLEGPWRNKWLAPFQKSATYYPPPRTVTALYHAGAIDKAQALRLLREQGLPPELAAAYVVETARTKVAGQKNLTLGQIETAYEDRAITSTQAQELLGKLGYDASDTAVVLAAADLKRAVAERNRAISLVRHDYLSGVIDDAGAGQGLLSAGVPVEQRDELLPIWSVEKQLTRKRLTVAEVKSARKHGVFDDSQAGSYLSSLGYSDADVTVLLSIP